MHEPPSEPISYRIGDEDSWLILPPGAGGDICSICRGVIYDRSPRCTNCRENAEALDGVLQPVISVSLYERPGRMRDWLTFYKDSGNMHANPAAQAAISQISSRFFQANRTWLDGLAIDFAVIVPSTDRLPPHPLQAIVCSGFAAVPAFRTPLNRTAVELAHNRPSTTAYEVASDVNGARILLLDDVYTSGARAQSAAYALRARGAHITALCVIGRRYNPAYSARAASVLAEQRALPYEWGVELRV